MVLVDEDNVMQYEKYFSNMQELLYQEEEVDIITFAHELKNYYHCYIIETVSKTSFDQDVGKLKESLDKKLYQLKCIQPGNVRLLLLFEQFDRIVQALIISKPEEKDPFEQRPDENLSYNYNKIDIQSSQWLENLIQIRLEEHIRTIQQGVDFGLIQNEIFNPMDSIAVVGTSLSIPNLLKGSSYTIFIPQCYPFKIGQHMLETLQKHGHACTLFSDSCGCVFIQRIQTLLFEPLVVWRDGACEVESPVLAFVQLARFFGKRVLAVAGTRGLGAGGSGSAGAFGNPNAIVGGDYLFDDMGWGDVLSVRTAVVRPEFIDYYITDQGILPSHELFRLF